MPALRKPLAEHVGHAHPEAPPRHNIDAATAAEQDFCPFPHEDSDPEWHPIAQRWFDSLFLSEQAAMYARSDVQEAVITARLISDQFYAEKTSAMMIDTITRRADSLVTTLGARLQRRIETVRKADPGKTRGQAAVALLREQYGSSG